MAVARGRRDLLEAVRRTTGEADAHLVLKRAGGPGATVAAVLDVLKGLLPVLAAVRWAGPYAVAACAVGAVTGHCWPPFLGRYAGRGLATASGTFLSLFPVEMVVAGIIRVVGSVAKAGGLLSTVGFALVPLVALLRGQPVPYVLAAVAINVLIFVRRLEGIEDDLRRGRGLAVSLYRRVVLDASASPDPAATGR